METKNKFLIFAIISFLSILLVSTLSSASISINSTLPCTGGCSSPTQVNTFLYFQNNLNATSMNVTQGKTVNLILTAFSDGGKLNLESLYWGSTLLMQENKAGTLQSGTLTYLYSNNYALNTGILIPGTYNLRFTAISQSGATDSSYLILTVAPKQIPDTTPPKVKILSPVNGATYNKNQSKIIVNIIEPHLNKCWYNLGNGNVSIPCMNGTVTIGGSNLLSHEGVNTWKVYAIDKAGNVGDDSVTFTVKSPTIPDTTAPTVKIMYPTKGLYTKNVTEMYVNVNDTNLQSCWYNLGNSNVSFSCSNGLNHIQNILSQEGSNTWKVYAKDKSGNVGSDSVTFTVKAAPVCDTTAPTVKIVSPLNITYSVNQTELVADINDSNLNNCWYNLGNGLNQSFSCTNGLNAVSGLMSHEGINTWTVYAKDKAGNLGSDSVTFTVKSPTIPDTTAPVVKILSPQNRAIYPMNVTQIKASITDNALKACWYNLGGLNVSFSCSNGINLIQNITSMNGLNTWTVYAKDKSGNIGSDTVSFLVEESVTPGVNENVSSAVNNSNIYSALSPVFRNETTPNYYIKSSNETIILTTPKNSQTQNIFQAFWDWIRRLFGWKGN